MSENLTGWRQEIVEWGLECARRGEVPDLEIPYSREEEARLQPVCPMPIEELVNQRVARSRLPTKPVVLDFE